IVTQQLPHPAPALHDQCRKKRSYDRRAKTKANNTVNANTFASKNSAPLPHIFDCSPSPQPDCPHYGRVVLSFGHPSYPSYG
ncbi:hypothetical protein FRC01_008881, partial [Tulasnella sp. 417]